MAARKRRRNAVGGEGEQRNRGPHGLHQVGAGRRLRQAGTAEGLARSTSTSSTAPPGRVARRLACKYTHRPSSCASRCARYCTAASGRPRAADREARCGPARPPAKTTASPCQPAVTQSRRWNSPAGTWSRGRGARPPACPPRRHRRPFRAVVRAFTTSAIPGHEVAQGHLDRAVPRRPQVDHAAADHAVSLADSKGGCWARALGGTEPPRRRSRGARPGRSYLARTQANSGRSVSARRPRASSSGRSRKVAPRPLGQHRVQPGKDFRVGLRARLDASAGPAAASSSHSAWPSTGASRARPPWSRTTAILITHPFLVFLRAVLRPGVPGGEHRAVVAHGVQGHPDAEPVAVCRRDAGSTPARRPARVRGRQDVARPSPLTGTWASPKIA